MAGSAIGKRLAWAAIPVVGAVAIGAYFTVAQGHPLAMAVIYSGLGLGATLAICLGIRCRQPSATGPWWLAAAAFGCLWVGDTGFTYYELIAHTVPPYPSWADAWYLAGYASLTASLAGFVHQRVPTRDTTSLIDALLIGCAAGLVAWLLFIDDLFADETLSAPAMTTALAYPLVDVIFVALLARLVFTGGARTTLVGLLVVSTCGWVVADAIYAVQATAGTYVSGSIVDLGWIGGYWLWSVAALHPRMARLTDPVPEGQATLSRRRLALLATASLLAPVVLIVKSWRDDVENLAVIGAVAAAVFVLVVLRLAGLANALGAAALRDPLTQLPNRISFMSRLERALQQTGRSAPYLAVLFIDIDRFKLLNDTMGHNAGDAVLLTVARRLEREVRLKDTVARLGGDEFVVVSTELADPAEADALAERMERAVAAPIAIDGVRVMLTASIGVAVTSSASADPERLVQDADAAMYRVKQRTHGCIEIVDELVRSSTSSDEGLVDDIARGLAAGEFVAYYQPIVDLSSAEVMGVEVLARWRHPEHGVLGPDAFLEVAESSGLIVAIGDALLRQAMTDLRPLRGALGGRLRLFVNVSGRQLQQLDLASSITDALEAAAIEPSALVLELHESIPWTAIAEASDLRRLVGHGVDVWLDDVGVDGRNLLHTSPVAVRGLKIDRQFVCGEVDEAAVLAVLAVARTRRQQVIAEGVETAEDQEILLRLGVRYAQGFHLGMPTTVNELVHFGVRGPVVLA